MRLVQHLQLLHSFQCCLIWFNHMHSQKASPKKLWQCLAQNIAKVQPVQCHAANLCSALLLYAAGRLGAKGLPSAFSCGVINGDAGEASRCQTCSASCQQQVHRPGRKRQACLDSSRLVEQLSKLKGTVQSNALPTGWIDEGICLFHLPSSREGRGSGSVALWAGSDSASWTEWMQRL